jgi:HlyD family secretion protein
LEGKLLMSSVQAASAVAARGRRAERDAVLPALLEFQWPSTAIVNAPVPRSARGIAWIIASMLAALITVAVMLPMDRVVTATGVLVSKDPTIVVQPLETSIVRSIEVREGQLVRAGTVIARLDPTIASANADALKAQVSSLGAEVARLEAEEEGRLFAPQGNDPNMALQASMATYRRAEFDLKIDFFKQKIDELTAVVARSHADIEGYRDRLAAARTLEQIRQELEQKQLGSRVNLLAATDARAEMARTLSSAEKTLEANERDLASRISERDGYVQNWHATVSQNLAEAQRKLSDAREELNKATLRRQLVELTVDQDATVMSVAKVSVGSILQSGQQFITLVPANAAIEAEANIPGQGHGFVHVGASAVIKLITFPFAQYGAADGAVSVVSPSSFTAQDEQRNPTSPMAVSPSNTEPYYRARISIDKVRLHNVPADFRLIPGMPVTVDINVGQRTLFDYLMGRVLPIAKEGMREP